MAPYCAPEDIDLGSMDLPRGVDVQVEIARVAEQIDSKIGRIYQLPLELSDQNPKHKPYLMMLKTANRFGVIGHITIKAAIGREDGELNAYGRYHLKKLDEFLEQVCEGKITFPDQQGVNDEEQGIRGPFAFGPDGRSRVEPFYAGDLSRPWIGTMEPVPWG